MNTQYYEIIKKAVSDNPDLSAREIARRLQEEGISYHFRTLEKKIAKLRKRQNSLQEFVKDYGIENHSLQQVTINEWTTTSFVDGKPKQESNTQIKVKASPNPPTKEFNFEEHLKIYQVPQRDSITEQSETIALINIYDAHIDKMSITDNCTVQDNVDSFTRYFNSLLNSVLQYRPSVIIFPIGSDFFNSNGLSRATKAGTPQDMSTHPHLSFDTGLTAIRTCIDLASQYSNIYIPIIQGNHDEDTCFYLGKCLQFIYERDQRVDIDPRHTKRKYFSYRDILLGFAHGAIEKRMLDRLPLIMAEEQKELWGNTTFRYWYLGDIHHKQEYRFLRTKDSIGCEVNFLRSISELDQWHNDNGYIGIHKSAEASIFAPNKGEIAKFKVNIWT